MIILLIAFLATPLLAQKPIVAKALGRYDGIGVRIEDNVMITESNAKLMSSGSLRKSEDIEKYMASVK
jgi:hypothetical protein